MTHRRARPPDGAAGRVILVGLGSAGDINPLLGIASALAQRGHETVLLAPPRFREDAAVVGADFAPLGSAAGYDAVYGHPDLWHPRRGLGVFFPWAASLTDTMAVTIEDLRVPGSTVVVAAFQCFGARLARETCGVPLCTVLPNPILLQSAHDPGRSPIGRPPRWLGRGAAGLMHRIVNREVSRHAREGVNHARRRLGLPPVHDVVGWSYSPDLVLGLWPSLLAPPQPDWPPGARTTGFVRHDGSESVGWTPPADLPDRSDWLVFTPGSQMTHGAAFFRAACDAAVALDAPSLLVSKDRSVLPTRLPPHVRHLDYAPFGWLFERARAVVHHGGIGTAGRALEAGLPQLIIPSAFDQFDNADRIQRLGAGRQLGEKNLAPGPLLAALEDLLEDEEVRRSCRRIRDALARQDALGDTCQSIEGLLREADLSDQEEP